jgi:TrpR-related protein YerC/YecD
MQGGCWVKRDQIDSNHEDALFDAILALQTAEEARNFFYDLCTPTELEGLVDRWRVAQLLVKNVPYRKIAEETKVSTATIVRVARFLNSGHDGYKVIMQRQGKL